MARKPIEIWNPINKTIEIQVKGMYYVSLTINVNELDWTDSAGIRLDNDSWIIRMELPGSKTLANDGIDYVTATTQKAIIIPLKPMNELRQQYPSKMQQILSNFVGFLVYPQ